MINSYYYNFADSLVHISNWLCEYSCIMTPFCITESGPNLNGVKEWIGFSGRQQWFEFSKKKRKYQYVVSR